MSSLRSSNGATRRCARKGLRIVVVDDHPVVREGIRMCLKDWDDLKIVDEAGDGVEGIQRVGGAHPDVVLLDLTMPRLGGLEAIPGIRQASPASRVIVLTVHNTREYIRQAMAARVDGFLLKDSAPSEYVEAIRAVMAGKFFISPAVARHARDETPAKVAARFGLSDAEFQYLFHAARGQRPAEMAQALHCTKAAVRGLRQRVFRKLRLRNMAMLTHFAVENGL